MLSNVGQELAKPQRGEEESLTVEIARVEAVLAERRYALAHNRTAVRAVGRTLLRAAHAAARALLGAERSEGASDAPRGAQRRTRH